MENEKPKRKHPRIKNYNYSDVGAYFITICTQNKQRVLSYIRRRAGACSRRDEGACSRRDEGACSRRSENADEFSNSEEIYTVKYTKYGYIAEKQLFLLEERYRDVVIDSYVIMPDHIHLILFIKNRSVITAGASPRPTVMDIICSYKSLTTRECKKNGFEGKLFQTSFFDHIIRNREDYEKHIKYIYENPMKWVFEKGQTNG